eukprot:4501727-Prymnesium_polylepis.2
MNAKGGPGSPVVWLQLCTQLPGPSKGPRRRSERLLDGAILHHHRLRVRRLGRELCRHVPRHLGVAHNLLLLEGAHARLEGLRHVRVLRVVLALDRVVVDDLDVRGGHLVRKCGGLSSRRLSIRSSGAQNNDGTVEPVRSPSGRRDRVLNTCN